MMDEIFMKKARLVRQFVAFLSEYQQVIKVPAPMKVVSSRFAKAMNSAGGFAEIIEELRRDGTIEVQLTETGGRVVSLANVTNVTIPLQVAK